jgi:hypothetical protein
MRRGGYKNMSEIITAKELSQQIFERIGRRTARLDPNGYPVEYE